MRVCLTQGPAQGLLIVSEPHGWAKEGRALLRPTHISGRLRSLGGGVSQRRLREQAFFERLGEWGGAGPEGLGRGGWVPIQRVLSAKSGLHLACLPPPVHPPGRGAQASDPTRVLQHRGHLPHAALELALATCRATGLCTHSPWYAECRRQSPRQRFPSDAQLPVWPRGARGPRLGSPRGHRVEAEAGTSSLPRKLLHTPFLL